MSHAQLHIHEALTDEQIASVFRGSAVRVTRQRTLIYGVLASVDTHPTAEELLARVHELDGRVSLATIYNTLETLIAHGLVRRIAGESSGSACRFDARMIPHVHMVMPDGGVSDVPGDLSARIMDAIPPEVLEQLAQRMGVRVEGIKIDLACSPQLS